MPNAAKRRDESDIFTSFVRQTELRREPDPALFRLVWEKLRAGLVGELRRKGLWSAPPHFVGIYGWNRWTAEALEELTADCFQYTFIERLARLRGQLSVKLTVEGLIWLNIRNFLHEKQRQHDPLGFRIYSALRAVALEAVERARLFVIGGDPKIRNDSLLAFSVTPELMDRRDAQREDLSEITERWANELLPELVTAVGAGQHHVRRRLARRLGSLESEGIAVFEFGQLLGLLKNEVRARWAALFKDEVGMESGVGENLYRIPSFGPELSFEHRDSYEKLIDCVTANLADLDVDEDLRTYLDRLWNFLCAWAVDRLGAEATDALPSARTLARVLDIPRARIPKLLRRLGRMVEACRANQVHSFVISG